MARPTKLDSIDHSQVEKLARLGATDAQIADFFDVTEQTINNWKQKDSQFFESLKRGKLEADARVADSLYHRALGYEALDTKFATHEGVITDEREYIKHYPPDTTAAIFWLKNRQPEMWRDRQDIDLSANIRKDEVVVE
jgi:transcriptional regulator with XRE-family HTH domain